jgi:hypothetical protein
MRLTIGFLVTGHFDYPKPVGIRISPGLTRAWPVFQASQPLTNETLTPLYHHGPL